jgi:hypothetical protein
MVVSRDPALAYSDYYVLVNAGDRGSPLGICHIDLDVKSARESLFSVIVELRSLASPNSLALTFQDRIRCAELDLVKYGFVPVGNSMVEIGELGRWRVQEIYLSRVARLSDGNSEILVTVELQRGVFPGADPIEDQPFNWAEEGF